MAVIRPRPGPVRPAQPPVVGGAAQFAQYDGQRLVPQPGRRERDVERVVVHPAADRRHGRGRGLAGIDIAAGQLGPPPEQGRRLRRGQGGDPNQLFTGGVQRLSAGRQDGQGRDGVQQFAHQRADGLEHMLAIVDYEDDRQPPPDRVDPGRGGDDGRAFGAPREVGGENRPRDLLLDLYRPGTRGQPRQPYPVHRCARRALIAADGLRREASLADTTGTGQGDQSRTGEQ